MAASSRTVCGCAAGEGEEEGDEGCWASYGRRHRLRRLPPPIPSLGRLARARTSDGRLVISREAAAHRVCGRKVEGRLILGVAESDADADATVLLLRRWSHPLAAQDASAIDDEEAVPVPEEGIQSPASSPVASVPVPDEGIRSPASSPVASAPPFPAVACSDGTIRAVSLGATPTSLPRMAH